MEELWRILRGPTRAEMERMTPFECALAGNLQFVGWMAVGALLTVPAGLVLLFLAFMKAYSFSP